MVDVGLCVGLLFSKIKAVGTLVRPKVVSYHTGQMDQAEKLDQISSWLKEEGLAPDSSKDDQLYFLCRMLHHTRKRLSNVSKDLETNRLKHLAEMAEVRKSLEQIRIFTEQKDVLAEEIQDENDQLRKQLQHLISLQDAQISDVAKMLYQQGLTELIHSSPSEQVAYLLVERASLLETNGDPLKLIADGNTESCLGTQAVKTSVSQSSHKRAPQHLQSAWKRIFGLHRTSQSKPTFSPSEATSLTVHASGLDKECSRLERDVEEGSRRLAMAHKEMRRLTDELESAHLTQKTYEPELQSAQHEVEQLRQEVEKLKKYEMVELRKTKELNDRLDLEIRALRNRVRFLDAEKNTLQQTVASLQEEIEELKSALQEQQEVLTGEMQVHQHKETDEVGYLQMKAEQLESAMQDQKLLTVQVKANQAAESEKVSLQKEVERLKSALQQQLVQNLTNRDECRKNVLIQSNQTCRDGHETLTVHAKYLERHSEIKCLQLVDHFHGDLNRKQDEKMHKQSEADSRLSRDTFSQMEYSFLTKELQTELCKENTFLKECPWCQEARKTLLSAQDVCESLKEEICEALKCLDKERSKYHSMKEKYKEKARRAEQKVYDEITRRDETIKSLERKLSLCSHSLTKERELTVCITEENEKLLFERRKLLQQLNEEEINKKESHFTASLSKIRVDCLETENKKLGNKILDMSNQIAITERCLQNIQSLRFAEVLQKISTHQQIFTPQLLHPSEVMLPEIQGLLHSTRICDTQQTDLTSSSSCCASGTLSRTAEPGYLNLTSTQSLSNHLDPPPSSE